MPNSRMLLSVLYKNVGLKNWVSEKMLIKIIIDTKVTFFLIMFLNIYYNNKELLIIYYFTLFYCMYFIYSSFSLSALSFI
jgi:hypothetical protein